jgi:hypothetical protein
MYQPRNTFKMRRALESLAILGAVVHPDQPPLSEARQESEGAACSSSERSSCCGAGVSYTGDGELICKACYRELEWAAS